MMAASSLVADRRILYDVSSSSEYLSGTVSRDYIHSLYDSLVIKLRLVFVLFFFVGHLFILLVTGVILEIRMYEDVI